jgi:Putative peptidoglycan binding domain
MESAVSIRRWRRAGLCALLSIALPVAAVAQSSSATTTPAPASGANPSKAASSKTHTASSKYHASSHSAGKSAAQRTKTSRGKKSSKTARKRGQQAIDRSRTREIQEALIREHYLQGEPSGSWDSTTQAAMQRFQADQGWQSKTTPDSRALIKLGLGPSHDHLLNPESAMTSSDQKPAAKPNPADPGPMPNDRPQH